jgi:Putative zinc-finger
MNFRNLKLIFSLRCAEASQLASESLDRELTPSERWALRLHTFVCHPCRRLLKQLRAMREAIAGMPDAVREASRGSLTQLSAQRRTEIKRLLREAQQRDATQ